MYLHVKSYKHNVNTMQMFASTRQIQVLFFGNFNFFKYFNPQLVKSISIESQMYCEMITAVRLVDTIMVHSHKIFFLLMKTCKIS